MTTHQDRVVDQSGESDLVNGDFALSAGFGSTASIAVAAKSKDLRGKATISSSGTGQGANPTVTLTFKRAFSVAPVVVVSRGNDAGDDQLSVVVVAHVTTTTLVVTLVGTPVAGEAYTVRWVGQAVE